MDECSGSSLAPPRLLSLALRFGTEESLVATQVAWVCSTVPTADSRFDEIMIHIYHIVRIKLFTDVGVATVATLATMG